MDVFKYVLNRTGSQQTLVIYTYEPYFGKYIINWSGQRIGDIYLHLGADGIRWATEIKSLKPFVEQIGDAILESCQMLK